MKRIILLILIAIFLVFGCTRQTKENESVLETQINENIIENNSEITSNWRESPQLDDNFCNEFIDIFRFTFYHNERVSDKFRYFETTLSENTPLYEVDGDENTLIKILPSQTKITILARENSWDNRYYLIKVDGDDKLWSGWIQGKYISNKVNKEIDNTHYGDKFLKVLSMGVSTRNDIFVNQTGWMGEFIVVKNTGEILLRLTMEELVNINSDAVDGSIIGWSDNNTKIWFDCNMDSHTACFGIIDIEKLTYKLLDRPPHFGSYQGAIDFDTGRIYYSDYYFQFDMEGARQTKESGQIFTLYSYNFFTEELTKIDTNIGEGFRINFDKISGFTYEKENNY